MPAPPATELPARPAPTRGATATPLAALDQRLEAALGKASLYLFLGALAVRLLYLSQYANSPFFWVPQLDALYHDLTAQAIAAGQSPREAFFRAPLYLYWLAAVYKLFGHSYWAARLIQIAVGAGSCVLLFHLGRRLFRPSVALLAAAAMALYGPLVYADGELHTPVAEVFLTLAFLLTLLRARESGRAREALAAGVLLGLAAITRPNILVATPLALFWLAGGGRAIPGDAAGRRAALRACAPLLLLFLLAAALPPALTTWRNARVAGDPVFIASQGGINLFLGNRPEANGFTPSTPKRYRFETAYEDSVALYGRRAAEEALGRPLSASEAQAYWVRRAAEWWRRDPLAALRLTWKKWVLMWTHREIRNNTAFDFIRAEFAPFLWLAPFGFGFAGTFGLAGMFLAWRSQPAARPAVLFVLLYQASFVPFFAADRFRLPVVPLLLLFGMEALRQLVEALRPAEAGGRARRLAPAFAAVAAAALWVRVDWYRTVTPAQRALDHWSAGNRYRLMGRLPEAEARYRKALALDPANPDIWTNLGAAEFGAGNFRAAAESFREAIRLSPLGSSGYYNLAMCALELGDAAAARRLLERATRLEPEHRAAREALDRLTRGGAPPGRGGEARRAWP